MGRKLKKYDEYFDSLETYLMASGMELVFSEEVTGLGEFVPSLRRIVIDENLEDSTEIAVLLHELGHQFDDALKDPKQMKKLDKAFPAFYKGKANKKQKKLVIECETRAWEYGKGIAKKLRIPLGKWYEQEKVEALKEYGEEAGTQ